MAVIRIIESLVDDGGAAVVCDVGTDDEPAFSGWRDSTEMFTVG